MNDDEWIGRFISKYRYRILLLQQLPDDELVICACCDGKTPGPEQCGCISGEQTVKAAIEYLEGEIRILEK